MTPAEEQQLEDIELEKARLGIEAEAFLHSTVGHYLIDRADLEIEAAMRELVEVDPGDYKANRDVRNRITVAKLFKLWIAEAINEGRVAHENFIERESFDS